MRRLSAPQLITVWETGWRQSSTQRALSLLQAACPEDSFESLARLSLGERDTRLLQLRESIFGLTFESVVLCDNCGQNVELSFLSSDIQTGVDSKPEQEEILEAAGCRLKLRRLNSLDTLAVVAEKNVSAKRRLLLEKCLVSAIHNGQPTSVDQLSAEVIEAAGTKLAELDPQADIQLQVTCPDCHNSWAAPFDIVSFFWNEIETWACRLIRDVHTLACAYGWSEREVFSLTPGRRDLYLGMVSV